MNMLAAFALSLSGFAALALSLDRHHAEIHGRGGMPSRSRWPGRSMLLPTAGRWERCRGLAR